MLVCAMYSALIAATKASLASASTTAHHASAEPATSQPRSITARLRLPDHLQDVALRTARLEVVAIAPVRVVQHLPEAHNISLAQHLRSVEHTLAVRDHMPAPLVRLRSHIRLAKFQIRQRSIAQLRRSRLVRRNRRSTFLHLATSRSVRSAIRASECFTMEFAMISRKMRRNRRKVKGQRSLVSRNQRVPRLAVRGDELVHDADRRAHVIVFSDLTNTRQLCPRHARPAQRQQRRPRSQSQARPKN